MMSCRAMGRGVIEALLAWLARSAARDGAQAMRIPCALNDRNVPLRLALAAAGFRAPDGPQPAPAGAAGSPRPDRPGAAGRTVFELDLGGPRPELPDWVTGPGRP
jgi:hypothetical protein